MTVRHETNLPSVERPGRTVHPFIEPDAADKLEAGIVAFPPGTVAPPHVHEEEEEVLYVIDGVGEIVLDGDSHTLTAGQFVHILPGITHQVRNDGPSTVRLLYVFAPPASIGTWE